MDIIEQHAWLSGTAGNDSSTLDGALESSANSSDLIPCAYEKSPFLEERFYLITVSGSTVATISVFNNLILVYVLSRPNLAASQLFYLLILAVVDTLVAGSYILLFPVQILYDYLENFQLYVWWNWYVKSIYAMSHTAITVSTYLIVAASADRCVSTWQKSSCTRNQRYFTLAIIIFIALLSKGVVYWEIDVGYYPHCEGFPSYQLKQTPLAQNAIYRTFFILWFRNVAHVFLPFILLIVLNGAIIFKLKRDEWREAPTLDLMVRLTARHTGDESIRNRRRNIRAATQMLLVLVATYLLGNSLSFVICVWENIDQEYLFENQPFYTFATDIITLSTVFIGSLRLPIYYACNNQIRGEIYVMFKKRRRWSSLFGISSSATSRLSNHRNVLLLIKNESMANHNNNNNSAANNGLKVKGHHHINSAATTNGKHKNSNAIIYSSSSFDTATSESGTNNLKSELTELSPLYYGENQ